MLQEAVTVDDSRDRSRDRRIHCRISTLVFDYGAMPASEFNVAEEAAVG